VAGNPRCPKSLLFRYFEVKRRHTSPGSPPLDEGSGRLRDLYPLKHNTFKGQISLSPAGLEHNPSKIAVAQQRLRTRGHRDRRLFYLGFIKPYIISRFI